MRNRYFRYAAPVVLAGAALTGTARAQSSPEPSIPAPPASPAGLSAPDLAALSSAMADMRAQIAALSAEVSELRAQGLQERSELESLKRALQATDGDNAQNKATAKPVSYSYDSAIVRSAAKSLPATSEDDAAGQGTGAQTVDQRLTTLEDKQQLLGSQLGSQYQSKVESASNYRVRLSGIVLLNLYENRGSVDNQDFPEIAEPQAPLGSAGAFGGSLRQSQIGLQAFGPDVAGARTSADVKFDFAGGFPDEPNGVSMGVVRLRTGTIRMDWENTSFVAGQDRLFFASLAPTSLASLAVPALSYAGNLWGWVPQARLEHRIALGESSNLLLQGGILDSFSGDLPTDEYGRDPSWGEMSGQPAYAGRIAFSHRLFGQDAVIGAGGLYGRQDWALGRHVDGWLSTVDLSVPLGKYVGLTAAFYRGRAVAGWGGGIGQDIVFRGSFVSPSTVIRGLDSEGGWLQLQYKATSKLQFNAAVGDDNPFADELRVSTGPPLYFDSVLSRNFSPFVNFIYQLKSDVSFSIEYRQIQTFTLDAGSVTAHHVNASLGYTF